jgi:arylsulfatase A-like enzyme
VLNIDVAPTILALAGLAAPERMQGSNLLPLVAGEKPSWRSDFFYEHHFAHPRIPPSEAVRTAGWKYMRFTNSQPLHEELYDLAADPLEEFNLAGTPEHADTLAAMRDKWQSLREAAR